MLALAPAVFARVAPPPPAVEGVEPQVRERLLERLRAVEHTPGDGEAWGRYGMALEAHRQLDAAQIVYQEAARGDDSAPPSSPW